jgi:hypothetical protein
VARLETIDGENWRDFVAAPAAVLLIGKTTCPACQTYGDEVEAFLAGDAAPSDVRFGKVLLDQRGLTDFKRANPWLAQVDTLPFTRIYRAGQPWKEFAGGGIDRLQRRLEALPRDSTSAP